MRRRKGERDGEEVEREVWIWRINEDGEALALMYTEVEREKLSFKQRRRLVEGERANERGVVDEKRRLREGTKALTESTTDRKRAGLSASLNSSIVLKFLSIPGTDVELGADEEEEGLEEREGRSSSVSLDPSLSSLSRSLPVSSTS